MDVRERFNGVLMGILLTSVLSIIAKPSPQLTLSTPSNRSSELLVTDMYYHRFSPLPEISFTTKDPDVLHYALKRVQLADGRNGLRVLVLMEPKKTQFI